MIVTTYGEQFECAKAIKGNSYIQLFDEAGNCIASFNGISDFSGYEIMGGEWAAPETMPTLEELQVENKLQKAQLMAQGDRQDFIEDCIAEMAMQLYA